MTCLPETGMDHGTVLLLWLGLILVVTGTLSIVMARRRISGPAAVLVIIALSVSVMGVGAQRAEAAPAGDRCQQQAAVAPSTPPTTPAPSSTTPPTSDPADTAPTSTTVPDLGSCGPTAPLTLGYAPSGTGMGYLLDDDGIPWTLPPDWAVSTGLTVRVEAGLSVPLSSDDGAPGAYLPAFLVPGTDIPGTVTPNGDRVEVSFDLSSVRAEVEAKQVQFIAAYDPQGPYVWSLQVRLEFWLARETPCPTTQAVSVPLESLDS